MEKDKITQKELKEIMEKEGIKLNDRMVNYYINMNLLPKPEKTIDKSVSDSDRAQNIFDYRHFLFMLEILKKAKSLGFRKISQIKTILGGGRYTLYEELMFAMSYIYDEIYNLDHESVVVVSSCDVRVNDRIFTDLARHIVVEPDDTEHGDYPFFPNYDIWHCVEHKREYKDKYYWTTEWRGRKDYFEIRIPENRKFDPVGYVKNNFVKLYFNKGGLQESSITE
jgi:hypothetical protein